MTLDEGLLLNPYVYLTSRKGSKSPGKGCQPGLWAKVVEERVIFYLMLSHSNSTPCGFDFSCDLRQDWKLLEIDTSQIEGISKVELFGA